MKNIIFIVASVVALVIISGCFGYLAEAVLLTILGLVVLAYVSWNFFNREHDWFTFTMCAGFGGGIFYCFYCVLSDSENMPWFYALTAGMAVSALLGCLYRKIHSKGLL